MKNQQNNKCKKKRRNRRKKIKVDPVVESCQDNGVAASASSSKKQWPINWGNYSGIKKLVAVGTFLFLFCWLGVGHGSNGGSGTSSSLSKTSHLQSDHLTSRQAENKVPAASTSTNTMQTVKRLAPVLAPDPDLMAKLPANSGNKKTLSSIAREDSNIPYRPSQDVISRKSSTAATILGPPPAASNLRLDSARKPKQTMTSEQIVVPRIGQSSSSLRSSSLAACEGADIRTCGCASARQTDYRGSIHTTKSGFECQRWDANLPHTAAYNSQNSPGAGLEGNNCRNPDGNVGTQSTYCYTTDPEVRWEYCDVPICEDSLPSASPTSSTFPTTSSEPTALPSSSTLPTTSHDPSTSLVPTPPPSLEDGNPQKCGHASVNQGDYRGSINTTEGGEECMRWDGQRYNPEDYPDAGLEGHNFCRNPGGLARAWCYSTNPSGFFAWCEVPYCFPPPTSCSSLDPYVNSLSEELEYACAYHKCADGSEYPGNSLPIDLGEAKLDCLCPYEIWDCAFGSLHCQSDIVRTKAEECCRTKAPDSNWTPKTASCECSIKFDCEDGNGASNKCHEFAQNCCEDDDKECKCKYQTMACHLALESDSDEILKMAGVYCRDAQAYCCGDDNEIGGCICDFSESLCNGFPNSGYSQCNIASADCCANQHCECDLFTHAENSLGLDPTIYAETVCVQANLVAPNRNDEIELIHRIYNETGGDRWSNNSGWMTNSSHCEWYGISCDDGHVIKIELNSNNISGEFPSTVISEIYKLKTLDLSDNNLGGTMAGTSRNRNDTSVFFNLRELTHVDLSQNHISGEVDVLFAPALEYVNFSHNDFTSINSYKKFKRSHNTLQICDLNYNSIQEEARNLMWNMPPNLEQLFLSNNQIYGTLPRSLENLAMLRQFSISSNRLSGELPDFSASFPNLQVLNLSDQKQDDGTGFSGTIPDSLSNLRFLSTLNLAGNLLMHTIPPVLGNFVQLKVLDLSENGLSQSIPDELGKLGDNLEILNLSTNKLTGTIPSELGSLQEASIHLRGNSEISYPAPLSLCLLPEFDLKHDTSLCPSERVALSDFYYSTKGGEWTKSTNWMHPYESHCFWHGVTCSDANNTVKLDLRSNGLSGTLSKEIANLSLLEFLDLSDNDIKGSIPTEISLLSNLNRLRLNHNSFIGNTDFDNLKHLQLIQLQGNRLSGTIPKLNLEFPNSSSYIADCGNPSDFEESLNCEECTMCCNAQGDCYPQEQSIIQKVGFNNYMQFAGIFFACIIGASFVLALSVFAYDKHRNRNLSSAFLASDLVSKKGRDAKYALNIMGHESVYQFFLGNSYVGWIIVLATLASQIGMLFTFVVGSEINLSDDNIDLAYTWKCPRDQDECTNTSDLNWQGWAVFFILMAAHLLKDIISGVRMIVLSAKKRHKPHSRMRFFVGGTMLAAVTSFTLYVSTIYNSAIATSNTEIIMNSVVILFITDVDELIYDILMVINPHWVENMQHKKQKQPDVETGRQERDDEEDGVVEIQNQSESIHKLEGEVQSLKKEVQVQSQNMKLLMEHNPELKNLLCIPQDDRASNENSSLSSLR